MRDGLHGQAGLGPMGTDEEAAGTPVSGGAVAAALRYETARPARSEQGAKGKTVFLSVTLGIFVAVIFLLYATL